MTNSILFFSLLICTLFACSSNSDTESLSDAPAIAGSTQFEEEAKIQTSDNRSQESRKFGNQTESINRKIIKEGELRFETQNIEKSLNYVKSESANLKGYASNEQIIDFTDKIEQHITIRVPAENFDLLLKRITQKAGKIESKNINLMDVTEEFIDIESRLKTKKELENRYLELLKKATKVDEMLNIEKEIGVLREEIESVEGRFSYLTDKIGLSTLNVTFYSEKEQEVGFIGKFGDALGNGIKSLLWLFVALLNIWPIILLGFSLWFFYKKRSKKKDKL